MRLDHIFGSRGSGVRIQDVVESYERWHAEREVAVRSATAHATAALGGSREALSDVKQQLKEALHGRVELEAFVNEALSPRWFGRAGEGRGEGVAALLELIGTLPDEHTQIRDELTRRVEVRESHR